MNVLTKIFKIFILTLILALMCKFCFADNLIVTNAIAELGKGETEANNQGSEVRLYTRGRDVAWCAAFVSWILNESNIGLFKYSLSAKAIYNEANRKGRLTTNPKAGDLAVFNRGNPKSWQAHIAIIEEVDNTHIYTIEGNVGRYPSTVKRFKYQRDSIKNLLGYINTGKD